MAADYSQIELRVMAHLCKDENLLKAFKDKIDIHNSFTAAEIFNINIEEITEDDRRSAKAINFGLIYGMSSFGLAKQLKIPIHEAKNYMNIYFERYPKIKLYMSEIKNSARKMDMLKLCMAENYTCQKSIQNNHKEESMLKELL